MKTSIPTMYAAPSASLPSPGATNASASDKAIAPTTTPAATHVATRTTRLQPRIEGAPGPGPSQCGQRRAAGSILPPHRRQRDEVGGAPGMFASSIGIVFALVP
jgi:hypothetical protein